MPWRLIVPMVLALFVAEQAMAAPASCNRLRSIAEKDVYKVSSRQIEACILRGFDPPASWRPDGGRGGRANVSGGGGFSIGNLQAPDRPPKLRGFGPSVSNSKMRFSLSFPPWAGFPCQIPGGPDLCGGGDDDTKGGGDGSPTDGGDLTGSSCPMAADNTGVFGQKQAVTRSSGFSLACGGAVPLTTYPMTLVQSPTGIAATENNSPYLRIYTRSGNSYNGGTAVALPTFLCKPTGERGAMEESIQLAAPRAQFITYNASTNAIALRLLASEDNDAADSATPLSPEANEERYLVLPMRDGVPQIPANCADQDTYYKTAHAMGGDMVIETVLEPGCEGSATECAAMGASSSPTATASCDTVSVFLSGDTPASASCADMTQIVVVDRPNLLHPPGKSATFRAIEGRTATMAASSEGSTLYLPSDSLVRLPAANKNFTLPEGGTLGMENGNLIMYGPATINSAAGQVTLTGGGEFRDLSGNTVTTYTPNSAVRPTGTLPYLLTVSRSITLPAGYELPTQPTPYIRAPLATP